ncbi:MULTISPECIES: hypothetical protein [Mycobacteriaceae]|uniref:Uncharacterized protein n=1 Tax=Mycolicibacterium farcinogenes TaxID=1802 RepID=A0ACD1FR56_MYCFR|nr:MULTISPECIES: hypothetical protein [Mycobacteriaceae]MBN7315026.1 hypothetical protein [Mycobacteroides abscessus subsp. abscessus]QZH69558.1 hypothetical protein K6L26_31120 [Mycolicibacterium farcinogenes]
MTNDQKEETMTGGIVTISGSMRNFDQMLVVATELTRQGDIVLMPFVHKGIATTAEADHLDALHLRKIDLSRAVVVATDELGYFGKSTRHEIEYAERSGMPVTYARVIRRNDQDTITFTNNPVPQWCETCSGKGTLNGALCIDCEVRGSGWRKGHRPEPAAAS